MDVVPAPPAVSTAGAARGSARLPSEGSLRRPHPGCIRGISHLAPSRPAGPRPLVALREAGPPRGPGGAAPALDPRYSAPRRRRRGERQARHEPASCDAAAGRDERPDAGAAPRPRAPLAPPELRRRRRALGLTQAALGAALGVAANTVARWERGARAVGHPDLVRLALARLERPEEPRPERGGARGARSARGGGPPASLTGLVGRERELRAVREQLLRPGVRLLTLVGPPGVGKTRLALEVAAALRRAAPGGARFADLSALAEPDRVLPALGHALGVDEAPDEALPLRLRRALGGRRSLLVVDNFEHLLPAAPALAGLLADCPRVTCLVTSRSGPLRLRGERVFPVPPLPVPDPADLRHGAPAAAAARSPAVALFVERARAVRPDFALTDAEGARGGGGVPAPGRLTPGHRAGRGAGRRAAAAGAAGPPGAAPAPARRRRA